MRLLLLVLILVHGLIHLMGFAKAFRWAGLDELTQEISRPVGLLWLLATLAFLAAAGLLLLDPRHWGYAGAPAVVLSQTLIILSWRDAKFGTLPNVVILGALLGAFLAARPASYQGEYRAAVNADPVRGAGCAVVDSGATTRVPPECS